MTTGKTIALTRRTFVGKVMSLLFNMPSRLVTPIKLACLVEEKPKLRGEYVSRGHTGATYPTKCSPSISNTKRHTAQMNQFPTQANKFTPQTNEPVSTRVGLSPQELVPQWTGSNPSRVQQFLSPQVEAGIHWLTTQKGTQAYQQNRVCRFLASAAKCWGSWCRFRESWAKDLQDKWSQQLLEPCSNIPWLGPANHWKVVVESREYTGILGPRRRRIQSGARDRRASSVQDWACKPEAWSLRAFV